MEFENPSKIGFTIYSKSGCPNCVKVKGLLKDSHLLFNNVDCDEYIIENKDLFLLFIKKKTNQACRMFPMVFNDGKFLGGYTETKTYIEQVTVSFEETLSF